MSQEQDLDNAKRPSWCVHCVGVCVCVPQRNATAVQRPPCFRKAFSLHASASLDLANRILPVPSSKWPRRFRLTMDQPDPNCSSRIRSLHFSSDQNSSALSHSRGVLIPCRLMLGLPLNVGIALQSLNIQEKQCCLVGASSKSHQNYINLINS